MQEGIVKFFDETKGYGFITTDEGKDVFVHVTALTEAGIEKLNDGQKVKFETVEDKKGFKAVNISLVEE